jgi:integrase
MLEDMQLRGLSARTQECDVAAVRQLADHFHTRPDRLTEEELRQYFLYLANDKKVARATATIALCGIRFFDEQTLKLPWTTLRFVRPAREKKLPVVLSRDEVRHVLGLVRIPVYRECLTTSYAGGLRLLEGARLPVADIDSGRMVRHMHGQGKQDRYVPLPAPILPRLRAYWRTHRSPAWVCPAPTRRVRAADEARGGGPPHARTRRSVWSGTARLSRGPPSLDSRPATKVRSDGIWSPTCRRQLDQARALLTLPPPAPLEPAPRMPPPPQVVSDPPPRSCPQCRTGILIRVGILAPQRMRAP